jgi:adenine-specific DNA methylase
MRIGKRIRQVLPDFGVPAVMPATEPYPRRLIEVDLPIAAVSDHARDGRSVHHGHITAIHIWWARKPLPSCRAAALAASLIDPLDPACPESFKASARDVLGQLYGAKIDEEEALRRGLLRLVSDFASWQRATDPAFRDAARTLAASAHASLFESGPAFLADPFCGGGSIPLEGLRLGATSYASDLNPVATLISKVTLEYVQRFGDKLFAEVERWGAQITRQAKEELQRFYPVALGQTPIAYISFRRIQCEGPTCGADVVLTSKFHLVRRGERSIGLRLASWDHLTPRFEIAEGNLRSFPEPTVRRGAATCLKCGYTIPVERVREQLTARSGGAPSALLVAVAVGGPSGERSFRTPTDEDRAALVAASKAVDELERAESGGLAELPNEPLPPIGTLGFRVQRYGMVRWRDLFTPRQLLTITTLVRLVRDAMPEDRAPNGLGVAVRSCLALAVDRLCDHQNTGCSWNPSGSALPHLFTRQALPIIWDYGEANPLASSSGSWAGAVEHVVRGLRNAHVDNHGADVGMASASHHPLPTDCAHILITDPPYYDAIPYADLSDFFYVWLRRMLAADHPELFKTALVPRENEAIVNPVAGKDREYYRRIMTEALAEARRVTRPDGIGVIIFAHKSTSGWEDLLAAMIDAGWIITASWPIDTENATRLRARNSAVLGSSIHLVCRPREHRDGTLVTETVGDWRDILSALPKRIAEWMPRLAREGIVGADAIFACLGPALELFSRFARVEKVSGAVVPLEEYLEQVWATVSREALAMIFDEAETAGLEEDARITAMWLWTLAGPGASASPDGAEDEGATDDDATSEAGFSLEYDAARKIAQGLGARLEALAHVVEVKGETARLVAVAERAKYLFGGADAAPVPKRAAKKVQLSLFAELDQVAEAQGWGEVGAPKAGATTLDRVHQAMLLFASGRGEALKRFLVQEGVGQGLLFWKLGQSFSALYPSGSDEKRWIDGVLARKKGLGFG